VRHPRVGAAKFQHGFRLRFAFRGYTPGCFAKSVEVVENALVADA
jgi:hypothetical protein